MDIRSFRYFVTVARAGSFSGAAQRLNVAQPALSRAIKKLEEDLGVDLLARHGRGVELTEAGAVLLGDAEALVDGFGRAVERVRGGRPTFSGQVALGVAPTSGLLIVPNILPRFRQRFPDATLSVREGISTLLEEWLLARKVDVAVLHNPMPLDGVELRPILQERMVLATAPHHPAAAPDPMPFGALADIPLVLPALPHSNRRLLERVALQSNVRLNVAYEIDGIPLIKSMVREGFGATIQTYAGVAREAACGELAIRPIERPALISTICLGMRTEDRTDWLRLELLRLVESCVAELVRTGAWAEARLVVG